jgi:hypothetical protein
MAQRVAKRLRWLMDDAAQCFAASLPNWLPFLDTNTALNRLATTPYTPGIPSNVDNVICL